MNHVIERMLAVLSPGSVRVEFDQALHPNLADASGHAARFQRLAVRFRVRAFDTRVAGDAFLGNARVAPIHALLVGAGLDALAVTAALALIEQNDAVLRALINGLAGAGGQAGRVGAVIANTLQVEEPS